MHNTDIEKINRENFREILDSLSMPGNIKKLEKIFDSYTLAMASVLLYSEVSYLNKTNEDFSIIDAITNAKKSTIEDVDYLFCSDLKDILKNVKKGTSLNPDYSCTIIFCCESFTGSKVILRGAGIDVQREEEYPINKEFIEEFNELKDYPLGNEIFFLNINSGEIKALSRTTKVELA